MAISSAQTAALFEIFGIPKHTNARIVVAFSHIPPGMADTWETTVSTGDMTVVVNALTNAISDFDGLSDADLETRLGTAITDYDAIKQYSQIKILRGSSGAEGVIVDHPKEVEQIRRTLSNLLGFYVPKGGWFQETLNNSHAKQGQGDR